MRGIDAVAVRGQRSSCRSERLCWPAQVARDQRDFCLGDDAPCAGHDLLGTEGPCRTSQQRLRAGKVVQLRHGDASKRKRRCVVAQGDPLQRGQRISSSEGPRRSIDQGVHGNPVTVVTPVVSLSGANSMCAGGPHGGHHSQSRNQGARLEGIRRVVDDRRSRGLVDQGDDRSLQSRRNHRRSFSFFERERKSAA